MSVFNKISIFIPCAALNKISESCLVFGHFSFSSNTILINCTLFVDIESSENSEKMLDSVKFPQLDSSKLNFLGILYTSEKEKELKYDDLKFSDNPATFVLRFDRCNNSFHLENIFKKSSEDLHGCSGQIILYDNFDFSKSQLFPHMEIVLPDDGKNFISFLSETLKHNSVQAKDLSSVSRHVLFDCTESSPNYSSTFSLYCIMILSLIFKILAICLTFLPAIPHRLHETCLKIVTSTSVGHQLHQRVLHFGKVFKELKSQDIISLQVKNLISAIAFDLIIGWLITFTFLHSNVPLLLFDLSLDQTKNLVSNLQTLIHWLMGAPAGFKLNIPLNSALGHFFLYHIYLWEAYMAVVLPLFTIILKMSVVIGVLGVSFVLCLLSDLIALATIHIYCFYGYAARLYGYQVLALSSLWRLFRGKKWNPLRQRVDSYTYDIHQLFLGTLIFTVLLFLLPTVMIYYVVFTCLRIMVLVIQRLILKTIQAINVNPLYCAFSRIFRSPEVAGDVYFSVLNTNGTLTFSMEVTQISFQTVIKETLPKLNNTEEYLTWKDFVSSILVGKIIYPL